jgi:AraC-like DNA-binding protein
MSEDPELTTSDLDETRSVLAQHFYAMRIDLLDSRARLDTRIRVKRLGPVTVGDLGFGAALRFDVGELGAYHVNVPLTGRFRWWQGAGDERIATWAGAAVFQPVGDTVLNQWTDDCRALAVKIDRDTLETRLAQMLDAPVRTPIRFGPILDTATGAGRTWRELIRVIAADTAGLAAHPLVATGLRDSLLTAMLLATDHQYRDRLDESRSAPAIPRAVRRAMDLIRSHPEQPLTVTELALAAGCSERSLQKGFQRYAGTSPMTYLRQIRLERVHAELIGADPSEVTVTEVAARWGFSHQGRFAGAYRRRYGVTPSQSLRS